MRDRLLKFIEDLEGNILHVYKDVAGYDTVGIGHWISPSEKTKGYILGEDASGTHKLKVQDIYAMGVTNEQSYQILDYDMNICEKDVPKLIKVPVNENQLICLISFTFNCGLGALKKSRLLRLLNQGDYSAPIIELPKWRKAGGKVIQGLINRREKEVKMWKGIYEM